MSSRVGTPDLELAFRLPFRALASGLDRELVVGFVEEGYLAAVLILELHAEPLERPAELGRNAVDKVIKGQRRVDGHAADVVLEVDLIERK